MALSGKQVTELEKPLDAKHVSERAQSGRKMSYIEGWHAISEANRIFGFDGWTRETIDMRQVRAPEQVKSGNGKETWRVGFIAKVRITVGEITREGTGYGSGALPDLGEAFESAVKEAETDAMKRALMTFGNPFGLALYDKSRASVYAGESAPKPHNENPTKTIDDTTSKAVFTQAGHDIRSAKTKQALKAVWERIAWDEIPDDWKPDLVSEKDARLKALSAPSAKPKVEPNFDDQGTFPGDLPKDGHGYTAPEYIRAG